MTNSPPMAWQDIAAAKRNSLLATIPPEWLIPASLLPSSGVLDVTKFPSESGFFTAHELEITASTSTELIEKLHAGTWTAVDVTKAFSKRAAVAHQLTNCLTETLFPSALATAQALDDHFARTKTPIGPFHGLPISIKDNFNVIGKDSTVGFVSLCNKPAKANSVMVDLLTSLGAVLYVKTATPTAMMIAETVSNVSGRTTNPLNRNLSPGGSSGGESALIAFNGSPLGIGSDIGGSLRIPASATGLFTLRPSLGRFPTGGCTSGLPGQESVNSVNGPLVRTLDDLILFSKTIVDAEPWLRDSKSLPIPWRPISLKSKKLKFGVLWNDGIVTPTPPVTRALKDTVEKLKAEGHEIIEWGAEGGHAEALDILIKFFIADGGNSCRRALEAANEPWRPEMSVYENATPVSGDEIWQLQFRRTAFCAAYMSRFNDSGIDGIISPTTPYSTVPHGKFGTASYTGIWNILDYSAVNFPSGIFVDRNIDKLYPQSTSSPLSEDDKLTQSQYDVEAVHGMPVGLQVIGRRLEEEKVLAMVDVILGVSK